MAHFGRDVRGVPVVSSPFEDRLLAEIDLIADHLERLSQTRRGGNRSAVAFLEELARRKHRLLARERWLRTLTR